MFEFAHPLILIALAALPFLWYYVSRVRRNPTVVTPGVRVFKAVRRKRSTFLADWFYLAAAALLVIAIARPRTGDEKVIVRSRGIDIVLALDMSGSMRAIDVPRSITSADALARAMNSGAVRNRLDTAKEEIRKFILARPRNSWRGRGRRRW